MITGISEGDVLNFIRLGASVEIDAARFSAGAIMNMARTLAADAKLKICNSDRLGASDVMAIVRIAGQRVTVA